MKTMHAIDTFMVIGSVLVLTFFIGYYQPLAIGPLPNFETYHNQVLFSFEKADYILIDTTLSFSNPMRFEVEDDIAISLEPGTYYWKAVGIGSSDIRMLTIKSLVDLKLRETNESFALVNAGNEELLVDVYDKGELVQQKNLGVGASFSSDADTFIGGKA